MAISTEKHAAKQQGHAEHHRQDLLQLDHRLLPHREIGKLSAENMQDTLQKTYATLTALKAQEESGALAPALASASTAVDWRKSVTRHAMTCPECGQSFKQLSVRRLCEYGLDSRSYRTKYGMPQIYLLPPGIQLSGIGRLSKRRRSQNP